MRARSFKKPSFTHPDIFLRNSDWKLSEVVTERARSQWISESTRSSRPRKKRLMSYLSLMSQCDGIVRNPIEILFAMATKSVADTPPNVRLLTNEEA